MLRIRFSVMSMGVDGSCHNHAGSGFRCRGAFVPYKARRFDFGLVEFCASVCWSTFEFLLRYFCHLCPHITDCNQCKTGADSRLRPLRLHSGLWGPFRAIWMEDCCSLAKALPAGRWIPAFFIVLAWFNKVQHRMEERAQQSSVILSHFTANQIKRLNAVGAFVDRAILHRVRIVPAVFANIAVSAVNLDGVVGNFKAYIGLVGFDDGVRSATRSSTSWRFLSIRVFFCNIQIHPAQ